MNGQERKLTSETFPILPYEHQYELDELEGMVKDDNKTITDMYAFAKDAEIKELIESSEEAILKMSKSQFLDRLTDAAYRKRYSVSMGFIEKDKSVVAYSSFGAGFNGKVFDIDDDFKVGFYTNFDYGYMSYFRVCLFYKGVPIMIGPKYPENEDVLKCYADQDGVYIPRYPVRNTLELNATREDWKKAMDGVAMIYNKLVVDFSASTVQAIVLEKEFSKIISKNYFSYDILMFAK